MPAAWITEGPASFDAMNVYPDGHVVSDSEPPAGRTSDTIRYAFTFQSGGETLVIVHTGNIDDANWTPPNAAAVTAFHGTLVNGAEGTVTISDDPSIQETPNPGGVTVTVPLAADSVTSAVEGTAALSFTFTVALAADSTTSAVVGTANLTRMLAGTVPLAATSATAAVWAPPT